MRTKVMMFSSMSTRSRYGWIPDRKDLRDHKKIFTSQEIMVGSDKSHIDHRGLYMPPVYNQGKLGSCTANAICGAFEYQLNTEKNNNFVPSRLFVYYNERMLEGTVKIDSGASIRDGIKTINKIGVCSEAECPYDIDIFNKRPSSNAYKNAANNKCTEYMSIEPKTSTFKTALNNQYLVIFGFSVPEYFENSKIAANGVMTEYNNEKIIGGHAVVAVGYDDNMTMYGTSGYILVRNSWGPDWGSNGYFWMPYSFVNSGLLSDAWIIEVVT